MKVIESYLQELNVDLNIGDMILVGKWKNRKAIVQGFGENDKGQMTVKTDKGEYTLFRFRVKKWMPEKKEVG